MEQVTCHKECPNYSTSLKSSGRGVRKLLTLCGLSLQRSPIHASKFKGQMSGTRVLLRAHAVPHYIALSPYYAVC
jgi:hypothetical protein